MHLLVYSALASIASLAKGTKPFLSSLNYPGLAMMPGKWLPLLGGQLQLSATPNVWMYMWGTHSRQ